MSKDSGDILLDMEIELRSVKRELETSQRCRQGVLEHGLPVTSNLFLDSIAFGHDEIGRLKRKIFKFRLANKIEF